MSITPLIQTQPIEEEEEELQTKTLPGQALNFIQRQAHKEEEEELIQTKKISGRLSRVTDKSKANIHSLSGGGRPLNESERSFFEPRFGHDFSKVRIHSDTVSIKNARALNARAYTVGQDVGFGSGQYAPGTSEGRKLLAHELTHVVQQNDGRQAGVVQRQVGVGRDLKSARFSGNPVLERVFDGRIELRNRPRGRMSRGRAVRLIQEALMDLGNVLPIHGADGVYGDETEAAVRQFQIDAGAELLDGIVGDETLGLLDLRDSGATAGVNLTAARFAGNALLEQVLDGNRLLSAGSRGTAVRLIEESLDAMGINVGPTSPDTNFDADTAAAVEQFQGQVGAQVDGIVGPETMAHLDQHDPGGTSGAGVATAADFSESPEEDFAGYDDSVNPNWLVVPVDGRRRPDVTVAPAGSRPSYATDDPSVATIQSTEEGAIVTGVSHGETIVRAQQGAATLDRLRVSVKNRRNLTVGYHFMRDTAAPPQPQHITARTSADVDPMTSLLNRCWERQSNVRFRSRTADTPQLAGNHPDIRTTTAGALDWPTVTAHATGENYNVFLVWSLVVTNMGNVHPNGGTDGSGNTLVEDAGPCGDGLTLPHEGGHFLGIGPHTGTGLMQACAAGRINRRITKAQIDTVNL